MLDNQLLRNNLDYVKHKLSLRKNPMSDEQWDKIEKLEAERKTLQVEVSNLQAKRNVLSKAIGEIKHREKIRLTHIDLCNKQLIGLEEVVSLLNEGKLIAAKELFNSFEKMVIGHQTEIKKLTSKIS